MHFLEDKKQFLKYIAIVILLIINVSGVFYNVVDGLILSNIDENNLSYLKDARNISFKTFLSLSVLKSFLSIIEGSSVGISFVGSLNIQAGDIVQSFLDIIDWGWKFAFLCLIFFNLIILLYSNYFFISKFIFILCSTIMIVNLFKYKSFSQCLKKKIFMYASIILIAGVFIIPVSIFISTEITHFLSDKIQNDSVLFFEDLEKNVKEDTIEKYKKEQISDNTITNFLKWITYFDNIKDKFFDNTIKLICSYLINMLVFPMLVFLFCYIPIKTLFVIFYNKIVYNRSF